MKTIGLIGGMSWESSIEYYRMINEEVRRRLGKLHSAQLLMYSIDFAELEGLQSSGRWREAAAFMVEAARRLEAGGADFLLICANTMHKAADDVRAAVRIPILHIVDVTAEAVKARGLNRVGLLGTRFTMEEDFYRGPLSRAHGLEVIVPEAADRRIVDRIIYDELVIGNVKPESRAALLRVVEALVSRGSQGVILGCTELGLLVKDGDCSVALFDTTKIHSAAAVEQALR